jgi:hypothetical protein
MQFYSMISYISFLKQQSIAKSSAQPRSHGSLDPGGKPPNPCGLDNTTLNLER